MKNKLFAVFLALLGILAAAPSEKEAESAFAKIVQKFDFSPEPFRKRYKDPSMFTPPYEVDFVKWGKSYTEKYQGEDWTVFPANAVVTTAYGRFTVKVGVGLLAKGDEVLMRQATDHNIEPAPPPTAEELKLKEQRAKSGQAEQSAQASNAEREAKKKAIREQVEAKVASGFKPRELALSGMTKIFASVDGFLQPTFKLIGSDRISFGTTKEGVTDLANALKKWGEWNLKAKENKVTDVEKEVASLQDMKLLFQVGPSGAVTLTLSAGFSGSLTLTDQEAAAFAVFVEKLAQDLSAATKAIEDETAELSSEADKRADLFK